MGQPLKMVDWYDSFLPTFLFSLPTLHLAGLIYPGGTMHPCISVSFWAIALCLFLYLGHLGALPPNSHILHFSKSLSLETLQIPLRTVILYFHKKSFFCFGMVLLRVSLVCYNFPVIK